MPSPLSIDERLYRARALYEAAQRVLQTPVPRERRSAHTRHVQSLLRRAHEYIACIVHQNTLWARQATPEQYQTARDLSESIRKLYPSSSSNRR
jgi:transcriptional regulatory protein LevR